VSEKPRLRDSLSSASRFLSSAVPRRYDRLAPGPPAETPSSSYWYAGFQDPLGPTSRDRGKPTGSPEAGQDGFLGNWPLAMEGCIRVPNGAPGGMSGHHREDSGAEESALFMAT